MRTIRNTRLPRDGLCDAGRLNLHAVAAADVVQRQALLWATAGTALCDVLHPQTEDSFRVEPITAGQWFCPWADTGEDPFVECDASHVALSFPCDNPCNGGVATLNAIYFLLNIYAASTMCIWKFMLNYNHFCRRLKR